MTEAEFLKLVVMKCGDYKILYFHDYDSRRNPKGLPDLILAGRYHLIWRELKLPGNKPEGEQVTWKYALQSTGQDYAVWTPRDLDSGRIDLELASLNLA